MRYLTLADIHADATTLHRVLQATHGNYDQVILLGDYVGYGPEPLETLHMLRTLPIHTAILGNHDLAVLHRARGRETNRNRSPLEDIWSTHAAALDGASVAWLEDLALRGVVRGSNPAGDVGASEIVEGGPLD